MPPRRDVRELFEAVYGDDPRWFVEADRIEQLVAAGELEEAGIALSLLLFERHIAGRRNGIDVAIMRAMTTLLLAHIAQRAREDIELGLDALEGLAVPDLDRRARALGASQLRAVVSALEACGELELARRAALIELNDHG